MRHARIRCQRRSRTPARRRRRATPLRPDLRAAASCRRARELDGCQPAPTSDSRRRAAAPPARCAHARGRGARRAARARARLAVARARPRAPAAARRATDGPRIAELTCRPALPRRVPGARDGAVRARRGAAGARLPAIARRRLDPDARRHGVRARRAPSGSATGPRRAAGRGHDGPRVARRARRRRRPHAPAARTTGSWPPRSCWRRSPCTSRCRSSRAATRCVPARARAGRPSDLMSATETGGVRAPPSEAALPRRRRQAVARASRGTDAAKSSQETPAARFLAVWSAARSCSRRSTARGTRNTEFEPQNEFKLDNWVDLGDLLDQQGRPLPVPGRRSRRA